MPELDKYHLTYSPGCSKISHLLDVAEVHTRSIYKLVPRFEGGGAATFDFGNTHCASI